VEKRRAFPSRLVCETKLPEGRGRRIPTDLNQKPKQNAKHRDENTNVGLSPCVAIPGKEQLIGVWPARPQLRLPPAKYLESLCRRDLAIATKRKALRKTKARRGGSRPGAWPSRSLKSATGKKRKWPSVSSWGEAKYEIEPRGNEF
jgi:hypothetical protein